MIPAGNQINPAPIMQEVNFELHYYLKNKSHSIDAFIANKSQRDFLLLAREISKALGVDVEIEVYPLAEGGIRNFFRFKDREVKVGVSVAAFTMVLSVFIVNPASQITAEWVKAMFADDELIELQKENLRLQNQKLSLDTKIAEAHLDKNAKAIIHKSMFYKALRESSEIEEISISAFGEKNNCIFPERKVPYQNFPDYIVDSNSLPTITDDTAEIEIISPVLKQGDYKWRGIYKNEVISFSMKSHEFNQKVLNGEINFKNGFLIKCSLNIFRYLNENGEEKTRGYAVQRVDSYSVSDRPIETNEGRRKKLEREREEAQLKLPLD